MQKQHVGFEIRTLSNLIYRKINQMVAEEEETLTAHQDWVLRFLLDNLGNDVVQRDIEKRFSIRRSTASHMLQLMEKNGYILRVSVPQDARMKRIVITEKGREACERMKDRLDRFEMLLQNGISEEELELFLKVAGQMEENIK